MKTKTLAGLFLTLTLALTACHRGTHADTAADGNKVTESGHEIPKPVDDSIIEKSDVDPPKPEVK